MTLLLLHVLFLITTVTSACFTNSSTTVVKVYDNVLPENTREALHSACEAWDSKQQQVAVFRFPLESPHGHSLMEKVMNDILWKLYPEGNTTWYVEYWKRQTWNHILAHADMDEGLRKEQEEKGIMNEPFRHPTIGHVLYLKLGTKVKGPTCVWGNGTSFGGTLLEAGQTDMYIVPAVESRLLRFQGELLHAVPRPADLWLHPTHETEQGPDYERMVLLFNLWPTLLQGTTVREFNESYAAANEQQKDRSCHAFEEWKPVLVQDRLADYDDNAVSMAPIQFPIMGDERRRGTTALSAMMETNSHQAHVAFDESWQPTRIVVQPRRKKRKSSWLSYMLGMEL